MPAWTTSLLRELVSLPKPAAASRTSVSRPQRAAARATASPMTPAPITTTSTSSIETKCSHSPIIAGASRRFPRSKPVPAVSYRRDGEIAVLEIDNPPVNAASISVREGLAAMLQQAASDPQVKAIVLSGARGSFLAGADINEIASGLSLNFPTLRDLQKQLEGLTTPVIAAIEGVALGGGFEIALTCHGRVAAASARVGLPEVKLGLLPGAGGTQRVTRLAGPEAALEAITSGTHLSGQRALELGTLDAVA